MGNFHQSFNKARSSDDKEAVLKEALRKVIHEEQKTIWEAKLKEEYNVSKTNTTPSRTINWFKWSAVAASIMVLLYIGNDMMIQKQSAQTLAQGYLESEPLHHPGAIKGVSDQDQQNRLLAISLFDSKKYQEAIDKFNLIDQIDDQDTFYLGLSYLYTNQVDSAIPYFNALENNTTIYREEINWFLSVAYILNNNSAMAKSRLVKIENGEWNYQKAKKLLKNLE